MSIWGKLGGAAAGLAIGGPLGALLGAVAGHYAFDRVIDERDRRQIGFTIGLIALSAKMAKADGVVTESEVEAFRRLYHVPQQELQNVAAVFDRAKQTVSGFDGYARQLAGLLEGDREMLEDVLDALFEIAAADGAVHEREFAYLGEVARLFGFGADDFSRIAARHMRQGREDPYQILGVASGAGDAEVRRAWRRLAAENHPDRHIGKGLPEEFVKIATDKLARINDAYDRIARERGL